MDSGTPLTDGVLIAIFSFITALGVAVTNALTTRANRRSEERFKEANRKSDESLKESQEGLNLAESLKTASESYGLLIESLTSRVTSLEASLERERSAIVVLEERVNVEYKARLAAEEKVQKLTERVRALELENDQLKQKLAEERARGKNGEGDCE